ncbi:uncharacterized protein BDZ99DRAFT_194708 [Mytilinidion resinicola]|uniref:Uncharacterized protein n=1 Tax=Mytilinidion resinicola TaxID=574789 RepID=A0A6A6Z534_9PEZI|nr:uncharacterized protein BDZ99DRAFT_194708 [Mytilinidion resinicola]KAF2815367.1 hypothetical protein BDZ99DRAFT_194708 [Mytilinidion resinicola]
MEALEPNERFDILTTTSIQQIKNARLLSRQFCACSWRSFAKVLGQTTFFATRSSMNDLARLSKITALNTWVTTLTFSGMVFAKLRVPLHKLHLGCANLCSNVRCAATIKSHTRRPRTELTYHATSRKTSRQSYLALLS